MYEKRPIGVAPSVSGWSPGMNTAVSLTAPAVLLFALATMATPIAAFPFIRADANEDGIVDISDPIRSLTVQFLGGGVLPACDDAFDSNDDGVIDVSDAVTTLTFLFLGNTEIPSPGALACGPDPTADGLSCESFPPCDGVNFAEVVEVSVSGPPDAYTFLVTVRSPDTGCSQYADWWEIITPDGQLLYRRILTHSHANEQPFTRSGGPVKITASDEVFVRAHMNPSGYGSQASAGSPQAGFKAVELETGFAAELAQEQPLPSGCAF